MIYVYAVVELTPGSPPPLLPRVQGLDDRPVELRRIGSRVGAACSIHDCGSVPRTAQNVWAHERVVESLMRDATLLPARFGMTFGDQAALDEALGSRAERLTAGLDQVRGCVELGLRVLWRPGDAAPEDSLPIGFTNGSIPASAEGSGRAYMMARLARERRSRKAYHVAERVASELHEELAALARDSTRRVIPDPVPQLAASYLVPRERADIFNARVRQLAARHPHLRLLCTGPWPPYHFVPDLGSPEVAHA